MKSNNTRLARLESKFNLASSLVDDLDDAISDLDVEENLPAIGTPVDGEVATDISIMDMSSLRQDFTIVRTNVLKLVNTGQKILDQISEDFDVSDCKPSHIEALSTLQSTIGNNLKLMMDIYRDIAAIEKSRYRPPTKQEVVSSNVNTGQINNIMFAGSSSDLMALINNQGKTIDTEVDEITQDET
jgi:hypothetical protein